MKQDQILRVGIIGTGWIAEKAAITLRGLKECEAYAIGSRHFDVTREALLAGKPCLVEKAFMANHREAAEIVRIAHEQKVFLAEAIWTRYQPAVGIIRDLISSGRIGTPRLVTATLGYSMGDKPRIATCRPLWWCAARPRCLCSEFRPHVLPCEH